MMMKFINLKFITNSSGMSYVLLEEELYINTDFISKISDIEIVNAFDKSFVIKEQIQSVTLNNGVEQVKNDMIRKGETEKFYQIIVNFNGVEEKFNFLTLEEIKKFKVRILSDFAIYDFNKENNNKDKRKIKQVLVTG